MAPALNSAVGAPRPCEAASYTVGWIAPLFFELAAARKMFDEKYDEPDDFVRNSADTNTYSWGRIGKHNVVIASLPSGEYGTSSAATTAAGMRASLPSVRIGLLVGIGAAVTGEQVDENGNFTIQREIFLGDVVVSNPTDACPGVVQHDFKKAKQVSGKKGYQRNGFLDAPPRALRSAVGSIRAEHESEDSNIEEYLEVFKRDKKMAKSYVYPGADKDPLRVALLGQSKQARIVEFGDEAVRDYPEIHYGVIASGNILVKSAEERDEIVEWLRADSIDPICLEMEAGGLMNSFPCVVIRGISDYADDQKNDEWQKTLLLQLRPMRRSYSSL